MKDFLLTVDNLPAFVEMLKRELQDTPTMVISSQNTKTGKWSMAQLWRVWMAESAKTMAQRSVKMPLYFRKDGTAYGYRPFNKSDAHELFTYQWLGADAEGFRLSWAKTDQEDMRKANKGERYMALMKHADYCVKNGILLKNPRGSEFWNLKEQQNQ